MAVPPPGRFERDGIDFWYRDSYDLRVLLIPQTGPKSEADVAMRFVRLDDLPEQQRSDLDVVQTIVRDKQVPVSNAGRLKPSAVCREVEKALGVKFTASSDHARA